MKDMLRKSIVWLCLLLFLSFAGCVISPRRDSTTTNSGGSTNFSLAANPNSQIVAAGANAIYTDVWVSMNDDPATAETRRGALGPYRLDEALLDLGAPGAVALHCLPAHPGEEITAEVLYGSRQRIWDQAENRRHAQKALIEFLLAEAAGMVAEQ